MKIEDALEQLDAISAVASRTTTFDGLRFLPTAISSAFALMAALAQNNWVTGSYDPLAAYLRLWIGVAVLSLVAILSDMLVRYYQDPTARARRMTLDVMTRLSPSLVAGAAVTIIVFATAREVAWMLPGLWSLFLGLGIFAAAPVLPRSLSQVGIWYVGCGLAVLILARGDAALSAYAMAIPFGGGQCLAAYLMRFECTDRSSRLRSSGHS